MRKVLRKVASLSIVALLGILSFGVHANTAPGSSGHAMEGMKHGSSSLSCAVICTSATFHKEELIDENSEDDDDKADEPFYLILRPSPISVLEKEHDTQARIALKYEPPPGLPAYLALTVFRS